MPRHTDERSPSASTAAKQHTPFGSAQSTAGSSPDSPADKQIPGWYLTSLSGGRRLEPETRAVIDDIINPLYRSLVLQETDPVLRATGNLIVINQILAVLEQPPLLRAAKRATDGDGTDQVEYTERLRGYLKTVGEAGRSVNLHLALRRAKHVRWSMPCGPLGTLSKRGTGI